MNYKVICDETNNSEEDQRQGRMNVDLILNPLKIDLSNIYGRGPQTKIISDKIYEAAKESVDENFAAKQYREYMVQAREGDYFHFKYVSEKYADITWPI